MQTKRQQAPPAQLLRQAQGIQIIRSLGLPVRAPPVVGHAAAEPRIREPHRPQLVALAADGDDTRRAARAQHARDDGVGEDEVPEVVGAELPLEAIGRRAVRARHDARVEHEHVDAQALVLLHGNYLSRGFADRGEGAQVDDEAAERDVGVLLADGGGRRVDGVLAARGEDEEGRGVRGDGLDELGAEAVGRHAGGEDGLSADVG